MESTYRSRPHLTCNSPEDCFLGEKKERMAVRKRTKARTADAMSGEVGSSGKRWSNMSCLCCGSSWSGAVGGGSAGPRGAAAYVRARGGRVISSASSPSSKRYITLPLHSPVPSIPFVLAAMSDPAPHDVPAPAPARRPPPFPQASRNPPVPPGRSVSSLLANRGSGATPIPPSLQAKMAAVRSLSISVF